MNTMRLRFPSHGMFCQAGGDRCMCEIDRWVEFNLLVGVLHPITDLGVEFDSVLSSELREEWTGDTV